MLIMAPKHESENSGTCTASPPRGESEPFPACPDTFRKEKELWDQCYFHSFPSRLIKIGKKYFFFFSTLKSKAMTRFIAIKYFFSFWNEFINFLIKIHNKNT